VRQHVNEKLREWRLRRSRGVVMDGRAGAFEFPEAQVKLFLTASVMERAQRRFMELNDKWKDKGEGEAPIFEKVLTAIQLRDQLDIERPVYPLKQHNDALLIDSTELNTDQVFTEALFLCESRMRMRASA